MEKLMYWCINCLYINCQINPTTDPGECPACGSTKTTCVSNLSEEIPDDYPLEGWYFCENCQCLTTAGDKCIC